LWAVEPAAGAGRRLVLLLDEEGDGFLAAPVFPETEHAGAEDVVLRRSVLGYKAAVALGGAIFVEAAALRECEGSLRGEDFEPLRAFLLHLEGSGPRPAELVTGLPYLDERDVRYLFAKEFLAEFRALKTAAARAEDFVRLPQLIAALDEPALAAATATELPFGTVLVLPQERLRLRISLERDRQHCWAIVLDEAGEPSPRLDGFELVNGAGELLAPIESAQARFGVERVDGIGVRRRDGTRLAVQLVPRDG
jgi:hypothetical protein